MRGELLDVIEDVEMADSPEPMEPPPTYAIPVVGLVVGCGLGALEIYMIVFESRVEVNSLFLIPGALLLGVIGLFDPRVPSSLQPGARGYPVKVRVIANTCWVISLLVGAAIYFGLVR